MTTPFSMARVFWVSLGVIAVVVACSATGSTTGVKIWTPGGEAGIEISTEAGKFGVKVPDGYKATLQFKDDDGMPCGLAENMPGPYEAELPLPDCYASYDYTFEELEEAEGLSSGPSLSAGSLGLGVLGRLVKLRRYAVGCSTLLHDNMEQGFLGQVSLKSPSKKAAKARWAEILQTGPGTPTAASESIDAFISMTPMFSEIMIRSSLKDGFSSFVVAANGVPVADLASDLNVSILPLANDWYQVISFIPLSLLDDGAELTLTQQGISGNLVTTDIEILIGP